MPNCGIAYTERRKDGPVAEITARMDTEAEPPPGAKDEHSEAPDSQQCALGHFMNSLRYLSAHCQQMIVEEVSACAPEVGEAIQMTEDFGTDKIDTSLVSKLSSLVVESGLSLPQVVRTIRGQTQLDSWPSKNLCEISRFQDASINTALHRWNVIVREGVRPEWSADMPTRQRRPINNKSIQQHMPQIERHIRKGQIDGRYLVLNDTVLEHWPDIYISPIGVVEKASESRPDIRLINDCSYPAGQSINEFTNRENLPDIRYNPPSDIARRVYELCQAKGSKTMKMMVGDVAGAFRHVPIHEEHVRFFALHFGAFVILDMACGFGWCGSPALYSLAGTMIDALYVCNNKPLPSSEQQAAEPFGGNLWCDDHTCVEIDRSYRCAAANMSLRRAMASVLGPTSINEKKFTTWFTVGKSLGPMWDTEAGTVSIPIDKITRAIHRIQQLI